MARRPKAPINLSVLFDSKVGTLAQIKAKTNSLMLLSNIVRQICPDLPENAFNIANFVQSTLIIEVKSPVWGQRLQFERNNICQQLTIQTQGQFTQIEIKVNPQGHRAVPSQQTYQHSTSLGSVQAISTHTAEHLLNIAKNAPKGLKEKLLKLAANAKNTD